MKVLKEIKISVIATLFLAIILCGFYPAVVFALGQVLFPHQANGSLIKDAQGQVIASELLGQNFNGDSYFNPRPSAAGAAGYDASSSSGTNLGPTSQKLMDAVKQRVADYRKKNSVPDNVPVPADAVTSSASGLDPHITLKNALLQLPRVAQARKLSQDQLRAIVKRHTEGPDLGFLGEERVNVVTLNLDLDGKLSH